MAAEECSATYGNGPVAISYPTQALRPILTKNTRNLGSVHERFSAAVVGPHEDAYSATLGEISTRPIVETYGQASAPAPWKNRLLVGETHLGETPSKTNENTLNSLKNASSAAQTSITFMTCQPYRLAFNKKFSHNGSNFLKIKATHA